MKKVNWAILAPGNIARSFTAALQGVESAHLYSVASRNPERAKAFADEFDFETCAQNYQELISDPNVDAIYIASPHAFHAQQSIDCLQQGKAVLCEKPMTINTAEAQRVFDVAKEQNTFYMEAVWTRFMPVLNQVRKWVSDGAIGEVKSVHASFGIAVPYDENHRLYALNLAGGSLLDLGIYPITIAQWVMQAAPTEITARAFIGASGVDETLGMMLSYPNGRMANLSSALTARSNHEAWVYGTTGSIKIPQFWHPEEASLLVGDEEETIKIPHRVNGYEGEIEEVNRCLQLGLTESPTMPWSESLRVMGIMDEARRQIGLRYPMEA